MDAFSIDKLRSGAINLALMSLGQIAEDAGPVRHDSLRAVEIATSTSRLASAPDAIAEAWNASAVMLTQATRYFESFTFLLFGEPLVLAASTHVRWLAESAATSFWLSDPFIDSHERVGRWLRHQQDALKELERAPGDQLGPPTPSELQAQISQEADAAGVSISLDSAADRRNALKGEIDQTDIAEHLNDDYLTGWSHAEGAAFNDLVEHGQARLDQSFVPICLYGLELRCAAMRRFFDQCGWESSAIEETRRHARSTLVSLT